jgi:hypothetical protein
MTWISISINTAKPTASQSKEGQARRNQAVHATADVLHDAIHLLRAMAHADGKHQKGHQHRVRVECVAQ